MLKMIFWLQILSLAYIGSAAGESAWKTLPRVQFNGLTKTSITRLDACLRACLVVGWCNVVSYDNEATLPCEIQTSSVGVKESKETKDSVTSYVVEKHKLYSGKICWKKVPDKTAKGLVVATVFDFYECFLYCIATEICEILVYDHHSNSPCWLQEGLSGTIEEKDLIPMNGSVAYLLDKSCVFPEGLNVSQNGYKAEIGVPKSEQGESAWATLAKVQFNGLTKTSLTSLDLCLKICLYIGRCNIVSYDSEAALPCEIQTNSVGVKRSGETKDSITSYVVDKYKLTSGKKCWTEVRNKSAKGLVPISTRQLYGCFLYCLAVDICEALVYDWKSNPPCWIHEGLSGSIKEENLIPMEGSVAYLLDISCVYPSGLDMGKSGPNLKHGAPKSSENPLKAPFGL